MEIIEMLDLREEMISLIEGKTGTLHSMPWDRVSTVDILKLMIALGIKMAD